MQKMILQKADVRRLNKEKEELHRRLMKREQELHQRRLHKSPLRESPDRMDQLLKEVQTVVDEVDSPSQNGKDGPRDNKDALTQKDIRYIRQLLKEGKMPK